MLYCRSYYPLLVYLLDGVGHVGIYKPEEQVPEGPALSPQNYCTSATGMCQRQVDRQQSHAEEEKLVVVPEEKAHQKI